MQLSEKQFNTKATTDSFDEIYTNYDLSVNETYSADTGYPFDYPTRWLNDPSMNKRIAIRRLNVTPSSHRFTIRVTAQVEESNLKTFSKIASIDITEYDNLIKVLNAICNTFSYDLKNFNEASDGNGGLAYEYDTNTNKLTFAFLDSINQKVDFSIEDCKNDFLAVSDNIYDFLKFLNQETTEENYNYLENKSKTKVFENVWNRDQIHFHASFSTSRRKFIGKRGDFYQNLTLLYPPPTNESTFYIRFTSNGIKNILLRYCDFDVQLCFIVNYIKAAIL